MLRGRIHAHPQQGTVPVGRGGVSGLHKFIFQFPVSGGAVTVEGRNPPGPTKALPVVYLVSVSMNFGQDRGSALLPFWAPFDGLIDAAKCPWLSGGQQQTSCGVSGAPSNLPRVEQPEILGAPSVMETK